MCPIPSAQVQLLFTYYESIKYYNCNLPPYNDGRVTLTAGVQQSVVDSKKQRVILPIEKYRNIDSRP